MIKEDHLTKAIQALAIGVKYYLDAKPKLLRGEQADFENQLHKAVYALNFSPRFREILPTGLQYAGGQEVNLIRGLAPLFNEVSSHKIRKEEAAQAQADSKKQGYVEKGKRLISEGLLKKAYIVFRMGAKEFKNDAAFIAEMGRLLMQCEAYDEASELFVMAVDAKDDDVGALNLAGSALRKLGKFKEAEQYFSMALAIKPDDEVLLYNAARNYIDWRIWDDAYDALRAALKIKPSFGAAKKTLKLVEKKMFGAVDGK
jgi:tetratricopeptide (TPR) repeat protein